MRLLHLADAHGGLRTWSSRGPGGIDSAIASADRCLGAAIDAALEAQVDLAIMAGDLFHDHNPPAIAITLFAAQLERLAGAGIPTVLVPGNHDRGPNPHQPSILEAFRGPLVHVDSAPSIYGGADLKIGTVPSVSRHQALVSKPASWRAEADQAVIDTVTGLLLAYGELPEPPDVVVGHWPIEGSLIGAEADISLIPEPMIPRGVVTAGPWRWAAFGHIHHAQMIADEGGIPRGAYSGSLDRVSFSEETSAKSALIVDLSSSGVAATPIPLPARRLLTLEADVIAGAPPPPPSDIIAEAIVRVRGKVRATDEPDAWVAKMREHLAPAARVIFELERERTARPAVEAIARATTPLEALREWAVVQGLDEPDTAALLDYGQALLEGAA